MDYYQKYLKYKNKYLILKNSQSKQCGGSKNPNLELYIKVKKSNDINTAINEEEKKIYQKIKTFVKKYGVENNNGNMHLQLFIYTSMLTTLKQIKEDNLNIDQIVDPVILYNKLTK